MEVIDKGSLVPQADTRLSGYTSDNQLLCRPKGGVMYFIRRLLICAAALFIPTVCFSGEPPTVLGFHLCVSTLSDLKKRYGDNVEIRSSDPSTGESIVQIKGETFGIRNLSYEGIYFTFDRVARLKSINWWLKASEFRATSRTLQSEGFRVVKETTNLFGNASDNEAGTYEKDALVATLASQWLSSSMSVDYRLKGQCSK